MSYRKVVKHEVIDNFLHETDMVNFEKIIMSNRCPWFWLNGVTTDEDEAMIFHLLIGEAEDNSPEFNDKITSVLSRKLNMQGILRAKINCYSRTESLRHSNWHFDNKGNKEWKVAIFYINDNDGYTELKDGEKIQSKRNRLLLFNGNIEHRSTNCTDEKRRVNININYK